MASGTFTIAKGRETHYGSLPATNDALIAVLLRSVESDGALKAHDTLAAVLAANAEANFTNYARATLASVAVTVDDDAGITIVSADDFVWVNAGGTANNTIVKLLIGYDPDTTGGTDADIVPVFYYDNGLPQLTNGQDLTVDTPASGLWRASGTS